MATYNEHTGDTLTSGSASEDYRNNYDAIFGKKERKPSVWDKPVEGIVNAPVGAPTGQIFKLTPFIPE